MTMLIVVVLQETSHLLGLAMVPRGFIEDWAEDLGHGPKRDGCQAEILLQCGP